MTLPTTAPAGVPPDTGGLDAETIGDCLARLVADETDGPADVDPDETFEELGLDSLGVVNVANRAAAELRMTIKPVLLYDFPTIDSLARRLAEGDGG
ncbi:hypothetical protein BJF79_30220 [Actinomadura sp. CNU-125]|uniref:acyl carrier protein n=1 Tax=Actinomadura sp. CNU-125 TaxID=1904961 RepID=UPI000959A452|nr:acyl carrier protein [Actinomadura sp. CNU-125]OLT37070.1 hypothetical protein BJF79_30220 [Actinomadura sp. CNU-125]